FKEKPPIPDKGQVVVGWYIFIRERQKAVLRYHDPKKCPLIRQAVEEMGKKHLIGSGGVCVVPAQTLEEMREARRQNRNTRPALTKHTPIVHQRSNGGASGTKKTGKRKIG
ncbi:DUF3362 domain-containing protein, partial [Enterobacter hormaechei]